MAKNMAIALVLSLIAPGIGNMYNRLFQRGGFQNITNLVLFILNYYQVSQIITYIWYIWIIVTLYDTYQCTKAINENREIPLLFGKFNLH